MVRCVAGNYFIFPEPGEGGEPMPIVTNETGYFIYEARQKGLPLEHIIREYASRFGISDGRAREDVLHTIGELD